MNAFVTGGILPSFQRGTKSEALMSIADVYATYLALAGLSDEEIYSLTEDEKQADLPPIDRYK